MSTRRNPKAFDAIYLMTISLALFIVPVIIHRYVDETLSKISAFVIFFLIADFYIRNKMIENKRKRYIALKKEEKEILSTYREAKRK